MTLAGRHHDNPRLNAPRPFCFHSGLAKTVFCSYTVKMNTVNNNSTKSLTKKQEEVLEFIKDCIEYQGMPPTLDEIRRQLNVSSINGIRDHLRALERKGAIELLSGVSRGIRLVDRGDDSAGLPIIGRVAAGSPILAEQHVEKQCQLNTTLFSRDPDYLLRVVGTSMIDAGIVEGDLLAVHKTAEAREGQIVIARVNDEVTVKRFHREGHMAYLLAENKDFEPIEVDLRREHLAIEGVVVGVVREF